jgi:hypothetical protein
MLLIPLENSTSHVDLGPAPSPLEGCWYSKPRLINIQLFSILLIDCGIAESGSPSLSSVSMSNAGSPISVAAMIGEPGVWTSSSIGSGSLGGRVM